MSSKDTNTNLVVDQGYLNEMAVFFKKTSQKADLELTEITQIIDTAQEAFQEGKTAEALSAYAIALKQLNGLIQEYGYKAATVAETFSDRIDDIDKPPV